MRSKRVIELDGIVLVLFGVLTIIRKGNSVSVCDTLQPSSICKETIDDRQLQLVEDSDNNGKIGFRRNFFYDLLESLRYFPNFR